MPHFANGASQLAARFLKKVVLRWPARALALTLLLVPSPVRTRL